MAAAEGALPEGIEQVEVIIGTYEEFVIGYKLTRNNDERKYALSMSFTNHSQTKSIRAVSTIGKYIAAGSADESINLINMDARVEHGSLQEQNGTITCLTDFDGTYLFSGCDDGTICIWKKGSWMCEKTLRAHTGGVVDVSVHPSGKLALSIGKDKAMKTWNLVKGRCGYVTNLKVVADAVRWSPEGSHYAVSLSNRVDVYSLQNAKVVYSIPFGKRVSCICFIDESTIVVAGEKESIEIHDMKSSTKLTEFNSHKNRVKSLRYVPELEMLFSASNDGFIKIWSFKKKNYTKPPKLLTEIDTTCRITCMDVWIKATDSTDETDVNEEVEEVEDQVDDEDNDSDDSNTSEDVSNDEEESDDSEESEEEVQLAKKKRKVEASSNDSRIDKIKSKASVNIKTKNNRKQKS